MGAGLALVVLVRLGLGVTLLNKLGVEEPAPGLVKLHLLLAQNLVELLRRQAVVLGDLGGGDQRRRRQHHVVLGHLRCRLQQGLFGGEPLGPLGAQGGDCSLQELIIIEQLVDGVHAVTADGREDVVEHPRLELPGDGQLGGDDQPVQVAFADEPDLLDATSRFKGVVIHDSLAVTRQGIFRVGVAEGGRHVLAVEQDLPARGDGSDRTELVVGERM